MLYIFLFLYQKSYVFLALYEHAVMPEAPLTVQVIALDGEADQQNGIKIQQDQIEHWNSKNC